MKPMTEGRSMAYPASETLSAYVNEPFYPALAARLELNEMSGRKRSALDRYREDKRALQHELRTELSYILQREPAARQPLLTALAKRQEPKIADLEERAEELRSSFNSRDYAWGTLRKWKLGHTETVSETPAEVYKVMLSAVYFQNGLSAAQRALLREIAIEVARGGETAADAMEAQPYVFFSPSPARVRFAEKVPDAVAAKLARYNTRKSALRKQLYDAVYRQDAAWFDLSRIASLASLAERQAPEFAGLEELAEEIRRDLAPMPPLPRLKPLVELPPVLSEKLTALFRRNTTEQTRIKQEMGKIQERFPKLRISGYFAQSHFYSLVSYVGDYRYFSTEVQMKTNEARLEMAELSRSYDRVIAGMIAERASLRAEIAEALKTNDPSELNLALAEGSRRAIEQETDDSIDDYFVAVFEPGLSPGQRRLLFDAAIESMKLPLPGGELQPTERSMARR